MKITWSDIAVSDFEENLNYLYKVWNIEVVHDFTTETERILDIIKKKPKAFKRYKDNIRHVPITKHVTLYYRIENSKIELIRFWNNLQNPSDKKTQ